MRLRLTPDGPEVHAYTGGRPLAPDQPLLAFVHGAQHDHSVWALQSRYLAHHGFGVLAFDLPGHGRSGGPALTSIEAMSAWLRDAIPAACAAAGLGAVPPTVVVGHSMGSLIALELTATAPPWLAGIAMLATAHPMRVSSLLLDAARDDEARAFDLINGWSHARLAHRPGTPGPGFSVFIQNLRLMQRQTPGVLAVDFAACNAYESGLARAAALRCPALYLLGGRDQMTPPKAARAAIDATPNPRVVIVAEAGHALMAECPDATLDALRDWLAALPLLPASPPRP